MRESDRNRILNFLLRNEPIKEFEAWIYTDTDLEDSIGSEFYFELIDINYKDKFALDNLHRTVVGTYISQDDFEDFRYKNTLINAGWYPGRKIKVGLCNPHNSPEMRRAFEILEEFGGLKFMSPEKSQNWSLTFVEFLDKPYIDCDVSNYGLNKQFACFATAGNGYIDLYVDADNKFYQLDNVASEDLYEFKGQNFKQMMRQLLSLDDDDTLVKVGSIKNRDNSYPCI